MNYDFDDCFDEIEYIEMDTGIDVDYIVLNKIEQKKRKIKKRNKNKIINTQIKYKIENKE